MKPTPTPPSCEWAYSNGVRTGVSITCGVVGGIASLFLKLPPLAPLVGWDIAAAVYILWVAFTVLRLKPDETANLASSEDPDRVTSDIIFLFASLASLGAVGLTLIEAGKAEGPERLILVISSVVSVILSWGLVHTLYALRYARLYYDECAGGIDFNDDEPPAYMDFAYLAFTVGMTFQVSDTQIKDRKIRTTVLRHALLAYLFGTVIVATTINLVAGLSK